MSVQKGKLDPTNTTKVMENYYDDTVASAATDVNRSIHDGTDFVRLVLQRPQPITAFQGNTSAPDSLTEVSHYTNGILTPNPSDNINLIVISYAPESVSTLEINMWSTDLLDATEEDWEVSTSTNNTDGQFSTEAFQPTISLVESVINDREGAGQFLTTVTVGLPTVDPTGFGLPYWRLTHTGTNMFSNVSEVEIIEPLTPTITYFGNDGALKSHKQFVPNVLDACYDNINEVFYTIRFSTDTEGTTDLVLDDDFSDGAAGTASGTNDFNPARWIESASNTQFLRTGGDLQHAAAIGNGQIETTYDIDAGMIVTLDVTPTTLDTPQKWMVLRALDSANNTIMSEGIGVLSQVGPPTTTGVWFSTHVNSLNDAVNNSTIREIRPLWHNTTSGTDTVTVTYVGSSTWAVSGTETGALTDATTGVMYDEAVEANTPMSFLISSTAAPNVGELFSFNLNTYTAKKDEATAGTLGIERKGPGLTPAYGTRNVLDDDVVASGTTSDGAASIEIFGNTNDTIDISADDFTVISGTASFATLAVFTVEKTDDAGVAYAPPLIESFNVINDPSKNYNDYLDGKVQIAATASGGGGGFIYLKVEDALYKYANNVALGVEGDPFSGSAQTSTAQIASEGTSSLNWTHESGVPGLPFLSYIEYNQGLDTVHLRTLDKDTLQDTTSTKEILLSISNYDSNQFKAYYDQNDFDTLYYVDGSYNLQSFNTDDRLSAFMAVNADDTTLPAGTAQQTPVNADVINAWGEALAGKTVTFQVTGGDGAVTPATDDTDGSGRATTTFSVGSTVGVSTITATVTETT